MEQKELKKMLKEAYKEVEKVRGFNYEKRVTVTDLQRSPRQWRKDLEDSSILEVMDRSETTAFLLKPEAYKSLMNYITALEEKVESTEEQLETAQIDALYKNRVNTKEFYSGEQLLEKAMNSFDKLEGNLRGLMDEKNQ